MGSIVRSVIVLVVFSTLANGQENPQTWLPLKTGTRWTYDLESKSGDRTHPVVDHWTTEEAVTGQIAIQEGLVVLREVKQANDSAGQPTPAQVMATNGELHTAQKENRGNLSSRDQQPWLVHGNCVYVLDGGWDAMTQTLRANYRQDLNEGRESPDFCFPPQPGRAWGNTDTPWRVEPSPPGADSLLPPQYSEAIHIHSTHFGSGGSMDIWFQKGIGIVREHYTHNGTYEEFTKILRNFSP